MTALKLSLNDTDLDQHLINLKLAEDQENNAVTFQQTIDFAKELEEKIPEVNVSTTSSLLTCLTCKCKFSERNLQISHYRSDWHQFNLKQKLLNQPVVMEEYFESIADTLSISGSDSDSDDGVDDDDHDIQDKFHPFSTSLLKDVTEKQNFVDDRRPEFYFKNENNDIISIYKKVLLNNQFDVVDRDITKMMRRLVESAQTSYWIIILLSAGHFAAAVFKGTCAITHKTFHRYIVRAKRGTVQSINDSNNRGHTAKSAGASLRRHNEAALQESIKSLINQWKEEYFEKCSHIFIRMPQYRKAFFYGGKDPLLNHKDDKLRSIPFVTRRPTFNEVKRVHKELFSITLHENLPLPELLSNSKANNLKQKQISENEVIANESVFENFKSCATNQGSPKSSNPRKQRKSKRKSSKINQDNNILEVSDDFNELLKADEEALLTKLYTACKTSNVEVLSELLYHKLVTQANDNDSFPSKSTYGNNVEDPNLETSSTAHLSLNILNRSLDGNGDTLLHIASRIGNKSIIFLLLEHGCDPTIRNFSKHLPYSVCSNKEAKNTYRRFRAKFPDLYKYDKAQIAAPLTDEIEIEIKNKQAKKKRAQRANKKEKEKQRREEEERDRLKEEKNMEEQTEKERFLALSDREKRLIAVERRFAGQSHLHISQAKRCYTCAESLFAKVPFEYYDYQFCSVNCLKIHKSKS